MSRSARHPHRPLSLLPQLLGHCRRDRIGDEAASIAFYFFLSLFPMIIVLLSLTALIGREAAFDWILEDLLVALPREAAETIGTFVGEISIVRSAGALSVGALLTVWSASNIFAALAGGLNKAYEAKRRRKWWQKRALALALVAVLALALMAMTVIILAGPEIARLLQIESLASALHWPLTFLAAVCMLWLVYYWLPNHDQSRSKRWILFGALVATGLWGLVTFGFRLFLASSGRFSAMYGFLGGMVALQIWLYLTAMSILVGGELAAAMERRAVQALRSLSEER